MRHSGKLRLVSEQTRTLTSGGEALRVMRELSGYSQERAGQLKNKDPRQVRRWETGESPVDALDLYLALEDIAKSVTRRAA